MAFESKDNLYVFYIQNNRIQVLNSSTYIISRGKKDIDDEFFLVQNVVNDKSHIHVADCLHPELTKIRIINS
jgi:hypothetical protein